MKKIEKVSFKRRKR